MSKKNTRLQTFINSKYGVNFAQWLGRTLPPGAGYRVADWLAAHPAVDWVSYAGLESSPFHKLQRKFLPKGPGAVFTFGLTGGYEAGKRLVESVQVFSHLANIGDTRSLLLHPASTTHRQLTEEQRAAAGAGAEVIRISVGLENAADLIRDLEQALG